MLHLNFGDIPERDPYEQASEERESVSLVEGAADVLEPFKGVASGVAKVGKTARIIGGLNPMAADKITSLVTGKDTTYLQDAYFKNIVDPVDTIIDMVKVDTENSGLVAQGLHKFAELGTQVVLARGSGAPMLASEYTNQKIEYAKQGYDNSTARNMAVLDAATAFVGVKAPAAIGKGLIAKVASGVGLNVALGVGDRAVRKQVLESSGYNAEEINALDTNAMIIDGVFGGVMGGAAKFAPKAMGVVEDSKGAGDLLLRDVLELDADSAELVKKMASLKLTKAEKTALFLKSFKQSFKEKPVTPSSFEQAAAIEAHTYNSAQALETKGELLPVPAKLEEELRTSPEMLADDMPPTLKILDDDMQYVSKMAKEVWGDRVNVDDVEPITLFDRLEQDAVDLSPITPSMKVDAESGALVNPLMDDTITAYHQAAKTKLEELGDNEGIAILDTEMKQAQEDVGRFQQFITCFIGR